MTQRLFCKSCGQEVSLGGPKHNCPGMNWRNPAVAKETQEYTLRAMATNYSGGHQWDKLDTAAVLKAADEIRDLRAPLAIHASKLAEVERERDKALEELGRVIMACPQGMRTSPASDGVTDLRRKLEEARKALKPFAADADNWADNVPDDYRPRCTEPGKEFAHPGSEAAFTVGDLRRARAITCDGES